MSLERAPRGSKRLRECEDSEPAQHDAAVNVATKRRRGQGAVDATSNGHQSDESNGKGAAKPASEAKGPKTTSDSKASKAATRSDAASPLSECNHDRRERLMRDYHDRKAERDQGHIAPSSSTHAQRTPNASNSNNSAPSSTQAPASSSATATATTAAAKGGSAATNTSTSSQLNTDGKYDEKDGHYKVLLGERIGRRYLVESHLGAGTFGRVVSTFDLETGKDVAIKIIRNVPKYRHAAKIEISILQNIASRDRTGAHSCVRLLDCFDYRRHICMLFDVFGPSLYDFLETHGFQPFHFSDVLAIGHQIFDACDFLHRTCRLTHTDLKPENIVLVSGAMLRADSSSKRLANNSIRIIDFGSATWETGRHTTVVSTRHYRAPEVILEIGWSHPCDIWSVGCILLELYTGRVLFQTHDNLEHMAMMERVVGLMPCSLVARCKKKSYFNTHMRLTWPVGTSSDILDTITHVESTCKPLNFYTQVSPTHSHYTTHRAFLYAVQLSLQWETSRRGTALQVKSVLPISL